MDVFVKNKEGRPMAVDKRQRAWARRVEGAPGFYRARTSPYRGRRTLVKTYPTLPKCV